MTVLKAFSSRDIVILPRSSGTSEIQRLQQTVKEGIYVNPAFISKDTLILPRRSYASD